MAKQIKSRQRVVNHGEVFTDEREVRAMCDLVANETNRISSRFLEPACGDGNFLAEILIRKLTSSELQKYKRSSYDWERYSLLALGSIYGVDILADNCIRCRERLFDIWNKEYKKICKKECNDDTRNAAQYILSRNIICGDALKYHLVNSIGEITEEPIIFSEWSFPRNDAFIYRKDYSFDALVNGEEQVDDSDGEFIMEYKAHYRRLGDELEENTNE